MMTKEIFENIVADFNDIVDSTEIVRDRVKGTVYLFKAKIKFSSQSKLAMTDHNSIVDNHRKYSFHWMQEDNSLIIRWDNSHYHDNVETAPHHKHVGDKGEAEPSEEMDLRKVLTFIKASILD